MHPHLSQILISAPLSVGLFVALDVLFKMNDEDTFADEIRMLNGLNLTLMSFIVSIFVFMKSVTRDPVVLDNLTMSFIVSLFSILDFDIDETDDVVARRVKYGKMSLTSISLSLMLTSFFVLSS